MEGRQGLRLTLNLDALAGCLGSASCAVTQTSTGLIVGMLLFLVASGLSLIFGVLGVINFAHGAFYMLGAYFAFTAYGLTGSFALAIAAGALGVAAFGIVFERLFMSRVYGRDVLMQLLVCYAFILILDDAVKTIYGAEYHMMGMPDAFALPPVEIAGGFVPGYYLFMIGTSFAVAVLLWFGINKTRLGKVVRAAAINPQMVGALGINTTLVYAGVFGAGSLLAGSRGARGADPHADAGHGAVDPDRELHRDRHRRHGLDRRRVHRRHADRLRPVLRLDRLPAVRRRGDVRHDGPGADREAERPAGPAGVMRAGTQRDLMLAGVALVVLLVLPVLLPQPALRDFLVYVIAYGLLAMSLNLLVGFTGPGLVRHAAYFASGAYTFGLLMQSGQVAVPVAMLAAVGGTALLALAIGAICVRLQEIYFAFITLAFQMFIYSVILTWVGLTGGDQGLRGGIPRPPFLGIDLNDARTLYAFCVVVFVACLVIMRQIVQSPFGYTLRMVRDNPGRANFVGVNVLRVKLAIFVIASAMASVGGVVLALFVSGAYPEFAFWSTSGEAIFMLMLGGTQLFIGPLVGTVILQALNHYVTILTEHHGMVLGTIILVFVLGLRRGLADWVYEWLSSRQTQRMAERRESKQGEAKRDKLA